jgi:hypothetical protein
MSFRFQESISGFPARNSSLYPKRLRNSCRNITGKREGKEPVASLSMDGSIILKWISEK